MKLLDLESLTGTHFDINGVRSIISIVSIAQDVQD